MSTKICRVSNLERKPVTFRGNTGESFHLAPGESGREVRVLEVAGNPIVDKLQASGVLAVEAPTPTKPAPGKSPSKSSKKKSSKKKSSRKKSK